MFHECINNTNNTFCKIIWLLLFEMDKLEHYHEILAKYWWLYKNKKKSCQAPIDESCIICLP